VEEMLREGWDLVILDSDMSPEDKEEICEAMDDRLEELAAKERLEDALIWSAIYGGAGIVVGNDQNPSKPINLKALRHINYLVTLDRRSLISSGSLITMLTDPWFGYPRTYSLAVSGSKEQGQVIDQSHILRFDGVKLPLTLRRTNQGWGDSVYSRLHNTIRNYETGHDSAATILHDFSQAVVKLKGLSEMLASGEDDLVTQRLELVSLVSSICNMIVIEDGEEYERKSTSVAGLAELLEKTGNRLVGDTNMPHTILLGESPDASNGTGNSTTLQWYDAIKNIQTKRLKRQLKQLYTYLLSERDGITGGEVPKFDIKFRQLWQMDEKERAEINETQSRADKNYYDMGAISSEEIVQSRFKPDGFSLETEVDLENRKAIDNPAVDPEYEAAKAKAMEEANKGDKTK